MYEPVYKKDGEPPSDFARVSPNEHELKVFELMRNLDYGEIRIVMKNSAVVQIEEKKSITL
ncbi:MAG: YezD family protein [Oscillospiraceae bacterium]|nr:YezD family protein [Oscillospiraceae bacterium]